MENMIQNIKIDEIIPNDITEQQENQNELNDLAIFIQKYGITEPIFVKPKNGKYEIVLGIQKYKAAKLLGLQSIPAIIQKEEQQKKLPSEKTNFISPTVQEMKAETNDIINLSELNKKEERDEFKMNNQEMQMPNMNTGANQPEPTFGGRFFPSLEDEPTNMNMGGMNIMGETPNNIPMGNMEINTPPQNTNEFIQNGNMNQFDMPQNPIQNQQEMANNPINMPQMDTFNQATQMPQFQETQQNMNEPMMNYPANNELEPAVQPNPLMNNPISPEIPNIDQYSNATGFDMSQNIAPNNFIQADNQQPIEIAPQNSFNTFNQPEPMMETPMTPLENSSIPQAEIPPQKDIEPVINAIKNLATSLQSFGYNMNISEEDTGTAIKVTIEVLK